MPMIALTFDDGPNTVITPRVLDILEENGAVGTFFLIAQNINPESAEMVRRAVSLGCDIENHSVTHSFMDEMTPEAIREDPLFQMLLSDGSLEAAVTNVQRKKLEAEPLEGTDATGRKVPAASSPGEETRPNASGRKSAVAKTARQEDSGTAEKQ